MGSVTERVKASFLRDLDRMVWIQPTPSHVIVSLNKMVYDRTDFNKQLLLAVALMRHTLFNFLCVHFINFF